MRSVWALVRLLWMDYDHKNIETYKSRNRVLLGLARPLFHAFSATRRLDE